MPGVQRSRPVGLLAASVAVPVALGIAEVVHPAWTGGTAYQALTGDVPLWLGVHGALMALFAALAWLLVATVQRAPAPPGVRRAAIVLLGLLALANLAYLAADGIGTGLLVLRASAQSGASHDAAIQAVQTYWDGPFTQALADGAGGAWALGLLACATVLHPLALTRLALAGWAVAFVLLVGGALVPGLGQIARLVVIVESAIIVYRVGVAGLPSALLGFAAVLPQHVGPQALLGVLCILVALVGRIAGWQERPPALEPAASLPRRAG